MCWITHKTPQTITAGENVIVYKVLLPVQGRKQLCISPVMLDTLYTLHTQTKRITITYRLSETFGTHRYTITKGYHSDATLDMSLKRLYFMAEKDLAIYKCMIPKGTIYYINEYNEIVSEYIIIKEKINIEL